ncbi:Ribonuclease [Hexamita inflata]|uniref:Ribonuclease n=1 Tax=Hexamita inflata TaxID=28002 RepID=A0AA86QEH4_9EUKA|nr:Ribonuclease [Hexamita inflata]
MTEGQKTEDYVVGIDEAGRGPVIGPMVYGIAGIPVSKQHLLKTAGANDSKQLTDADRRNIFEKLKKIEGFYYAFVSVDAIQISEEMQAINRTSLNQIAYNAARSLLENCPYKIQHAYIDLISPAEQYRNFIQQSPRLVDLKMTIEAKADANYPVTGAASIVAKVTRDNAIKPEWGSGYPSDPHTKTYIASASDPIFGFKERNVRFSWSTCQKIMEEKCKKCEWQVQRDADGISQHQQNSGLFQKMGFKQLVPKK